MGHLQLFHRLVVVFAITVISEKFSRYYVITASKCDCTTTVIAPINQYAIGDTIKLHDPRKQEWMCY